MKSEQRQRTKHIMVRVSPEELETIQAGAKQCDMSAPAFLRSLGQGYQPSSNVDHQAVIELAKLHGDVGRVGGLLKVWLSNEERMGFGQHLNIPELIKELRSLQELIADQVKVI